MSPHAAGSLIADLVEMAKAMDACKRLIDTGMKAVCVDAAWDGDKLKPGPTCPAMIKSRFDAAKEANP